MIDTRLLYALTATIAVFSGWFYYNSGQQASGPSFANQGIDYSARQIKLLQTDKTGQLMARTQAAQLQHHPKDQLSTLDQVSSVWYRNGQPDATLAADHVESLDDNSRVVLTGNVQVSQTSTTQRAGITLNTAQLIGYPQQRRIETQQPVSINSSQGFMTSQGLQADLTQGDYQFNHIRIQYAPAPRS